MLRHTLLEIAYLMKIISVHVLNFELFLAVYDCSNITIDLEDITMLL